MSKVTERQKFIWNDARPEEQQVEILPADLEFDVALRIASMDHQDEDEDA